MSYLFDNFYSEEKEESFTYLPVLIDFIKNYTKYKQIIDTILERNFKV